MPPATPKFARAPDGRVIQPPPVTKSPSGPEHPAHVMSACEDEITTSARGGPPSTGLATVACSAFTEMSARLQRADADGSLIITVTRRTVASPLNVVRVADKSKAGGPCVAGPVGLSQLTSKAAVNARNVMRFMVPSL